MRLSYLSFDARSGLPKSAPRRAFALIELLVVIAIVAILGSLLLPALSGAKARAKSIQCRSNLRQLDLPLAMYVIDFGGYPDNFYVCTNLVGRGVYDAGGTVVGLLQAEDGVRRCPTRDYSPVPGPIAISYSPGPGGIINGLTSYGYNGEGYIGPEAPPLSGFLGLAGVAANVYGSGPYRPVREAEVRVPSDMIALGDSLMLVPKSGSNFPGDTVMESEIGLARQETASAGSEGAVDSVKRAAARHRNQGNVAFCDAHVEALSFRRLFLDRDDVSLRRWNRDHEPHP